MHQALISAGRERMRTIDGDRRLGRHPGMADAVRAFHMRKIEALGDLIRSTHFFIDFHAVSGAHHLDCLVFGGNRLPRRGLELGRNRENRMSGVRFDQNGSADRVFHHPGERGEICLG